ncbi:MAG: hypothetical protein LUE14_04320 [Clostridiales bacterium]|nr:hypothetical protein [Clostridiales bacterium]
MLQKDIFRKTGEEVYSFFDAFFEGAYLDTACDLVDAMSERATVSLGPGMPEEVYLIPLIIWNKVSGAPVLVAAPAGQLTQTAGSIGHLAESYGFLTNIYLMAEENRARISMEKGMVICSHEYLISDSKKIRDSMTKRFHSILIIDNLSWEETMKKSCTAQWEYSQVKKILSDAALVLDGVHSPGLELCRQADEKFELFWDSLEPNYDQSVEYTTYGRRALYDFLYACGHISLPDLPDMYEFYSEEHEKLLHETDEAFDQLLMSLDGVLNGDEHIHGLFPGESQVVAPGGFRKCFAIQVIPGSVEENIKWVENGKFVVKLT